MAARVSNIVVTTLNVIFFLAGLFLIATGIYLHVHGVTICQKLIENSVLIVGSIVTVVSLLGFLGSCCKNNFWLVLYLILMFFIIIGLIAFAAFVFLVTNRSAGKELSGKRIADKRLGDYSNWLRNHFIKGHNWAVFKTCLADAQFCNSLAAKSFADFAKQKISPIQGMCCLPPRECGYEYRNATFWTVPNSGQASNESDCMNWSNKQSELCFNCSQCKAGFLQIARMQWRNLALTFCILIVFAIVVLAIGRCAWKNISFDKKHRSIYT